ncbi:MAG: hypothetical protein AMXMBFR13_20650 [Phycisphaerae bacterium]
MVMQMPDGSMEFSFFRPDARQVCLTGDFNGWHKASLPMEKGEQGWWRYNLRLAAGTYQFRYLADGDWFTDYAAFGLERGPFGWNSVLHVEPVAVITAPLVTVPAVPAAVGPEERRAA